jgi:hypothetical protein
MKAALRVAETRMGPNKKLDLLVAIITLVSGVLTIVALMIQLL